MTTDTVVLERALMVMAISMVVQTLLFAGAAIGAFIVWRRTAAALADAKDKAEAQVAELRVYLDRMAATIDETSRAIRNGSTAVDDVMTDVRDAMGTVRNSVGTVAQVVSGPRAALALGLWRGINVWRKRRAAQRVARAATSEL
jgi:ABC-type transporter Mla subunit MlaD